MSAAPIDALTTKGLQCIRGRRVIVKNVTLSIPTGQWTAIVGPNGAGKSTLLRSVAGLLPYDGEVYLGGIALHDIPPKILAQRLAWMGQDEPIPLAMQAYDVVMAGRIPHIEWWGAPTAKDRHAVEHAMRSTQTWEWRGRAMHTFSRGEQQRVLLARVQAVSAEVVLLDEPLVHLDHHQQRNWIKWVKGLRETGITVVSVLHELGVALQSDTLIVLGEGSILYTGNSASAHTHRALESAFDKEIHVCECNGHLAVLLD